MAKVSRTFRLDKELVERFDKAVTEQNIDKTQVVTEAIKKFVEAVEMKNLDIFKYEVIELDNNVGGHYYTVRFANGTYYVRYDDDKIKTTNDIGFAARYLQKENAVGEMELIQKYYTKNGIRK